jgi:hypothetical protein
MDNISLIFTDHKEHGGLCKSHELFKIIEKISPDIIFEELHIDLFDEYYKKFSLNTLETNAINLYLRQNPIMHVPVDRYDLSVIKQEYFIPIYRAIDQVNPYHSMLWSMHIDLANEMGFKYLNSELCTSLLELKRFWVEKVLNDINNIELSHRYKKWIENQENRENEMIKNIYNYKHLSNYSNGLFWIGAEHRKSIMNKIKEYESKENLKINWRFYNETY